MIFFFVKNLLQLLEAKFFSFFYIYILRGFTFGLTFMDKSVTPKPIYLHNGQEFFHNSRLVRSTTEKKKQSTAALILCRNTYLIISFPGDKFWYRNQSQVDKLPVEDPRNVVVGAAAENVKQTSVSIVYKSGFVHQNAQKLPAFTNTNQQKLQVSLYKRIFYTRSSHL